MFEKSSLGIVSLPGIYKTFFAFYNIYIVHKKPKKKPFKKRLNFVGGLVRLGELNLEPQINN